MKRKLKCISLNYVLPSDMTLDILRIGFGIITHYACYYLCHDVYFHQPNVIKLARKSISVEIKRNKQTDSKNPGFLNSIIIFVFERIDGLISLKYSAAHCTVQYLIEEEAIPLTNLTKHMTHTDCYAASGLDYIK